MASITGPSHLISPLATPAHLETSASQLDGISKDLEDSVRYETTRLLEASGILLRLPQEIIAQSIVLLSRFWSGADGASMLDCDAKVCRTRVRPQQILSRIYSNTIPGRSSRRTIPIRKTLRHSNLTKIPPHSPRLHQQPIASLRKGRHRRRHPSPRGVVSL